MRLKITSGENLNNIMVNGASLQDCDNILSVIDFNAQICDQY